MAGDTIILNTKGNYTRGKLDHKNSFVVYWLVFVLSFWRIFEINLQLLCKTFRNSSPPPSHTANLQTCIKVGPSHCHMHMIMVQQKELWSKVKHSLHPSSAVWPWTSLHQGLSDGQWYLPHRITYVNKHESPRFMVVYTSCLANIHFFFFPKMYIRQNLILLS